MQRIASLVLLAFLVVIAVRLALWLLRQSIGRAMLRGFMSNRPRVQPLNFVRHFRDFVFKNPLGAKEMLFAESATGLIRKMWHDSKAPPQNMQDFGLPDHDMSIYRAQLSDHRSIVVITLPPPEHKWEPYLAAVVFPTDALLHNDALRARATTRFFYLNRGSSQTGRETDLCGWTSDGQERWYNVGAPTDAERFAQALAQKLGELGM